MAKPHMVKSTVVDSDTGKSKDSRYDTSIYVTFIYLLLLLVPITRIVNFHLGFVQVLARSWLVDVTKRSGPLKKGLQILPFYL